ncbi:MAG: hypothetical protein JWO05_3699 [Gemmatimonadetes bacterium]|nr:hypothetical protein [Gemmatimonadota bacterium]
MKHATYFHIACAMTLAAARPAFAQQAIPVRTLPAAEAVSRDTFRAITGVRELSDGRVMVNDPRGRRLMLLDGALALGRVIADTTAGAALQYGARASAIIPYAGDSTLFVDGVGRALVVLGPTGSVARVMSAPRPNDVQTLATSSQGSPRMDAAGRLIYRSFLFPAFRAPVAGKQYVPPMLPDSAPLLRVNFDTRVADTIAWLRIPKMLAHTEYLPNGAVRLSPMVMPVSTVDDWVALPDGSVAVLRGSDYHLDWIAGDARRATAKMPFDWKRLTDDEKDALVDSAKKVLARQAALPPVPGQAQGHSMTIMPIGGDGRSGAAQAATPVPAPLELPLVAPASEMPDYYPPVVRTGMMRADPQGRVWILPATSAQSGKGLLYDVVDRDGRIVERVRLPEGRTLEGFGANGVAYLSAFSLNGVRLERVRLR